MGNYANRPECDIEISGRGRYFVRVMETRPVQFRNPTEITDYVEGQTRNLISLGKNCIVISFDPRLQNGIKSQVRKGLRKKGLDGYIEYLS